MKVSGETFSLYHEREGAKEVRYHKYPNFQVKGLLPDSTLESFIPKSNEGAIPNHKENSYRVYSIELFLIFSERIFQVNQQNRRKI